jgi:hypothetical protein
MPARNLLIQSDWIWPRTYWREEESAWLTAHKFGFANALRGSVIGRALATPPVGTKDLPRLAPSDLFRRIATDRARGARTRARDDVFRALTLGELFGEHDGIIAGGGVRFCPVCMGEWFHASLFQLFDLHACPIHDVALKSGCPHCGKPLETQFDPREFSKPLHCIRCGEPFAGRTPRFTEVFGDFDSKDMPSASKLVRMQRQLVKICHTTRISPRHWAAYFPTVAGGSLQVLVAGTSLAGCRHFASTRGPLMHLQPLGKWPDEQGLDELPRLMRELRSIRHHLAGRVRRWCGHQHVPPLEIEKAFGRLDACWLRPVAPYPQRRGVCACCYAFARWSATFGTVFWLYTNRHKEGVAGILAWRALPLAQTALSLFSVCVVQAAYFAGLDPSPCGGDRCSKRTEADRLLACREVWPFGADKIPVREDPTTISCAGYTVQDTDRLLARLAGVCLMPTAVTGFRLGSTERDVWGGCVEAQASRSTLRGLSMRLIFQEIASGVAAVNTQVLAPSMKCGQEPPA